MALTTSNHDRDAAGLRINKPLWRQAATHTLHTSLLLKAKMEERLQEETGLLLADNEALLNLSKQPLRMSDIAHKLILSRGGTTKVIDRLEDLGYVARTPDPEDRRSTVATITALDTATMPETDRSKSPMTNTTVRPSAIISSGAAPSRVVWKLS